LKPTESPASAFFLHHVKLAKFEWGERDYGTLDPKFEWEKCFFPAQEHLHS
jgi:hypothetical protein